MFAVPAPAPRLHGAAPSLASTASPAPPADVPAPGSRTERLVVGYLYAFPLLWAIGLTLPALLLILAGGTLLGVRSRRALLLAAPWFLVGLAQATSVVFNAAVAELGAAALLRRLLGSYVLGWFVLGACIAIGASGLVRQEALLRALRRFALYFLALGIPTLLVAWALGLPGLSVPGPIGMLLPADLPARRSAFSMVFFNREYFLGLDLLRLAIFFPWATALGFGGVALSCIGWAAPPRHRVLLVGVGVFMALSSLSRLALLNLVLCSAALWYLRRARLPRLLLAQLAMLAVIAVGLVSAFSAEPVDALRRRFHDVRPGASHAREAVYAANWQALREAPVLGHGWPGAPVLGRLEDPDGVMVPGSHSSVSGLLYKGGVLTFTLYGLAFLVTLGAVLRGLDGTGPRGTAAAILLALALTSGGESIESLAVPAFWAFLWIGMALAPPARPPAPEPVA